MRDISAEEIRVMHEILGQQTNEVSDVRSDPALALQPVQEGPLSSPNRASHERVRVMQISVCPSRLTTLSGISPKFANQQQRLYANGTSDVCASCGYSFRLRLGSDEQLCDAKCRVASHNAASSGMLPNLLPLSSILPGAAAP